MECAGITHEVRQASPARQCFGALLLLAISSLLTACGGDVTPAGGSLSIGGGGGGGGGGGAAVCVTGGTATLLTWDPVQGATSYRVYQGTASRVYQPFGTGVDSGAAISYQVPNLGAGTPYYFAVTAYDANGESSYSNEVCKIVS